MTEPTPDQNALAVAQELTTALQGMAGQLKAVNDRQDKQERYEKRSRSLIWLTVASFCLDIVLTVLLVFVYGTARNSQVEAHATRQITSAQHQNLLVGCRANNVSKADQILLWTHLVAISKEPPGTSPKKAADDKAKAQAFLAFVRKTFAPRNCAEAYKIP